MTLANSLALSIANPTWKTGVAVGAVFVLSGIALTIGILGLSAQVHAQAHTKLKLFGWDITDLSKMGNDGSVPLLVAGATGLILDATFVTPILVNKLHERKQKKRTPPSAD